VKNKFLLIGCFFIAFLFSDIPEQRVVAEWEPALGTMIRWPLGIPMDLVVELASDDIIYVLVENSFEENVARNSFNNSGVNLLNTIFIYTETYSHWTRDHGPQFLISENGFKVVNQQFNGYPVESGCDYEEEECDESMILFDCTGTEFCNNQPEYMSEGYDCYINNDLCEDFNGDGQIMDWLGDGYCDDGSWGLDFICDEYSWDCGDCGNTETDENGYCDDDLMECNRNQVEGRLLPPGSRGWNEDNDTNIDFANQLGWDILNLPLYWTGGNFMTDGYGMGFSTKLMVNENNITNNEFNSIIDEYLDINNYHIFDNPNEESIQHIDCLAKLVGPETIIIKQVPSDSPEYDCIESFADSFNDLVTFYGRPFNIIRVFCPTINAGPWEVNPVAAYTNSLILNGKVLVPQYGIFQDLAALETFREAMPGYEVIGFNGASTSPWYSEDALHCRTMGIFDPGMMHISHKSIRTEEIIDNALIEVEAELIDYSSESIESVILYWKYSAEDGPFSQIDLNLDGLIYEGTFPQLNSNALIEYYITGTTLTGRSISHPNVGWHIFTSPDSVTGDINGDGLVNVLDVISTVNIILGSSEFNPLSDINNDQQINVQDIILLVNMILG